ncbi:hypothetical protein Nmel_002106 [Mimus melanotis]
MQVKDVEIKYCV